MSRFLRRNAINLVALFLVLTSGAYAYSKARVTNVDLASGAVDTRTLAAGAVREKNFANGAVDSTKLKLDKLSKYVQTRITGTCPGGQKIQGILVDGNVLCVDDGVNPGSITGITTSGGLTGGGTSGGVELGLNPAAVQSRITGNCPANQAIDSVAQNGTVACKPTGLGTVTSVGSGTGLTGGPVTDSGTLAVDPTAVQRRVTGTCGPGRAITSVNADGTVNCVTVEVTEHSGYVQLNDNPSQSTTLLSFGGVRLEATCLSGGNAQVRITSNGGTGASIDFSAQTTGGGLLGAQLTNGNFATIVNTATNDLGRFNVTTSSGAQVDGTFLAWAIATTGGVDCVFNVSALAFPT
jgi:hypothetical protein